MLCLFIRRIVIMTVAAMLATSTVATAQPTIEQVNQALDLAEKAASHGMNDLSMRAVTRSLRFGPPTVSKATTPPVIRHFGARVDTSRPLPKTAKEVVDRRIPATVNRLTEVWSDSADPNDVYVTIRSIVLPAERPMQAFIYSEPIRLDPLQPDRIPPVPSLVDTLLKWARKADQIADLNQQLESRDLKKSVTGMLVRLLVGLELDNFDVVQKYTSGIAEMAKLGMNRQAAEFLATVGIKLRRDGRSTKVAARLLEIAGQGLQRIDQLDSRKTSIGPTVMLLASRCWFSAGDNEKGVSLLSDFLGGPVKSDFVPASNTRKINIAGKELFSRGLVNEGRELLGAKHSAYFERRYQFSVGTDTAEVDWSPPSESGEQRLARAILSSDITSEDDAAAQIWLCSLDLSTDSSRRLFAFPDFQHVASPAVSSDGSMLCFEASFPGEAITSGSRIYVTELASGKLRCLGRGTLPSWSPGGKRIVFSSFSPTRGVWISRLSAGDSRLIDRNGWSASWSPNGSMIAYSRFIDRKWDLYVYDIIENQYFSVFGDGTCHFSRINNGFQWSPDSETLLLKGSGLQLVEVPVLRPQAPRSLQVKFSPEGPLAWNSQGGIVAIGRESKSSPERLLKVDRENSAASAAIPGQFADRRSTAVAWMPDAQSLVYISKPARK